MASLSFKVKSHPKFTLNNITTAYTESQLQNCSSPEKYLSVNKKNFQIATVLQITRSMPRKIIFLKCMIIHFSFPPLFHTNYDYICPCMLSYISCYMYNICTKWANKQLCCDRIKKQKLKALFTNILKNQEIGCQFQHYTLLTPVFYVPGTCTCMYNVVVIVLHA